MKDFFEQKEERYNIFERIVFWLDDHFETIAGCIIAFLVIGFAISSTYTAYSSRALMQEQLWDLPTDTPGTYVRTDPDTDIEYIIVISSRGGVSICPREGVSNAH